MPCTYYLQSDFLHPVWHQLVKEHLHKKQLHEILHKKNQHVQEYQQNSIHNHGHLLHGMELLQPDF